MPKGGRQITHYCANATRKFLFDFAFAAIRSWGTRPEDRHNPRQAIKEPYANISRIASQAQSGFLPQIFRGPIRTPLLHNCAGILYIRNSSCCLKKFPLFGHSTLQNGVLSKELCSICSFGTLFWHIANLDRNRLHCCRPRGGGSHDEATEIVVNKLKRNPHSKLTYI